MGLGKDRTIAERSIGGLIVCPPPSIIGSLAGTSYWGPVAGHGFLSRDLDEIRAERKRLMPERSGTIKGPIEATLAGEGADNFVRIHKKEPKQEESKSENPEKSVEPAGESQVNVQ